MTTPPISDNPLAFATDSELLDEWARRWAGVLVVVAGHVPGEPDQEQRQIWWRGGYTRALGMAVHTYHRFIAGIADNIPADKPEARLTDEEFELELLILGGEVPEIGAKATDRLRADRAALIAEVEALRALLVEFKTTISQNGRTHWDGCEDDPAHWRCRLIRKIDAALGGET